MEGSPQNTDAEDRGELVLYVGLGQSLLASTPRLRPLGRKPGPIDSARAWVFSETGDPRISGNPMADFPAEFLCDVHPHQETGRSGPLTSATGWILSVLGARDRILTVNMARRGAHLSSFERQGGSAWFRNFRRCLVRAVEIARAKDLRLERLVVSWVHGQADYRSPRRRYAKRLKLLINDLDVEFREVVGNRGKLIFCLSQATALAPPDLSRVSLAQLDVARALPETVVMAGPEYMLERSDGVHLKPRSAVYLGILHGRAIAAALQGEDWQPLHISSAKVAGDRVTIRFRGGDGHLGTEYADEDGAGGPIRIGTRQLRHFGLRWTDGSNASAEILEARITESREVTLRLSIRPDPDARCTIHLGFPDDIGLPEGFVNGNPSTGSGGCTNLRTEGPGIEVLGLPVRDWAVQQEILVVAESAG